jgi:hypothetical protein
VKRLGVVEVREVGGAGQLDEARARDGLGDRREQRIGGRDGSRAPADQEQGASMVGSRGRSGRRRSIACQQARYIAGVFGALDGDPGATTAGSVVGANSAGQAALGEARQAPRGDLSSEPRQRAAPSAW